MITQNSGGGKFILEGMAAVHRALENGVKPRQLTAWMLQVSVWVDRGCQGPMPEAPLPWGMLRQYVLSQEGGMCQYCGLQPATTVDHILSIDQGGNDDIMNLVGACRSCNATKRRKHPFDWVKSYNYLLSTPDRLNYVKFLERLANGAKLPVLR